MIVDDDVFNLDILSKIISGMGDYEIFKVF